MSDLVALDERAERLKALTHGASLLEDKGLAKLLPVTDTQRSRIKSALNILLWSCLSSCFPEKSYSLSDDMLRDHEADILRLPNITPNGLILPKLENLSAFNLLQKEAIAAFSALGIGDGIARVQFPVNVRLQSGVPDAVVDNRPRASVKPHSDIWAGDPASGILVFLSVLGDPAKAGIDFMMPENFPVSFIRSLEDYNEGTPVAEKAKILCSFDARGWYFVDPYLIHRTTKKGTSCRISIDFRFIPAKRTTSDIDEDEARRPWFISFADWQQLGTHKMLVTSERIGDFALSAANARKDPYTVGYPVKLSLIDIESTHDTRLKKKAG